MSPALRAWLSALLGAVLGLALFLGATQAIRSVIAARAPGGGASEPILVVLSLLLGPVVVVFRGALGWRFGSGARPRGEAERPEAQESVLVIGYGNTLRRDDGAGYRAAEAIADWGHPGVSARAVHQLVPELAEALADVDRAIFIDARPARAGDAVAVQPVAPSVADPAARPAFGHSGDPSVLLALASELYGRCPPAWVVTIPAVDFGLGEGLSDTARRGLSGALRAVAGLLNRPPTPDRTGGC